MASKNDQERVMAGGTTALASKRGAAPPSDGKQQEGAAAAGGKSKKLLVIGLLVVVAAAAAWFFLLRGGSAEPEASKPGEVMALESMSVNLAGGHYLKVGLALQAVEGPAHEPDGSQALDIAIELLSGRDMAELASAEQRQKVKEELVHRISEAYHGDVMDVYFTEFVMQ
jgi:flagellar protein FliL